MRSSNFLVYVASGLDNIENAKSLISSLKSIGADISYDWTEHGPVYSQGFQGVREVSVKEINGVRSADVVIVLLPGGRGTHVELGAAIAFGKEVFIINPGKEFEVDKDTCAFYCHPHVVNFSSIQDAVNTLRWRQNVKLHSPRYYQQKP